MYEVRVYIDLSSLRAREDSLGSETKNTCRAFLIIHFNILLFVRINIAFYENYESAADYNNLIYF